MAWISEDIREIFEQGIESDSKEVIKEVGYLPVRLMRYAIDYKDHLIFQQFQYYPFRLYKAFVKAQKAGKDEISFILFDRSWRYLKEISDYYLEPKLGKEEEYPEEEVSNFACAIIKIFQGLLKTSFDERDVESFKTYLSTANGLFRNLEITNRYDNEETEQIANFLKNKKNEMLFGLASWIFYKLLQHKGDEIVKQLYNVIQNSISPRIEELTNVFSRSHSFEMEDFWGWDNWEMSEKEEGQVHSIQILEKLERFYAIKSLSLLSKQSDDEIEKIKLPHSRDLAYLAEGTGGLVITLDDIKTNPRNWQFVLKDKAIKKVDAFKRLLTKAKKAQEQEEVELKKEQTISQKRVQEFKKEVLKAFYEDANMRDIFAKHFNAYEDMTKEETDKKDRFGINIVEDKAFFFDEWHVHYVGWGESYGRDLASGENSYLLDNIAKGCEGISSEEFKETLAKIENPDDIVIFATNIAFWRFFEDLNNFKPKWHRDVKQLEVKGFGGWYKLNSGQSIPVFEINHQKIDKQILILNKSKIGKLIQLYPLSEEEKEESIEDIFYMDIQAFSENEVLLEELIKRMPEWLKKIGDGQKQREHLRERVRIQIFERFEYEKPKDFEGYKLFLKED